MKLHVHNSYIHIHCEGRLHLSIPDLLIHGGGVERGGVVVSEFAWVR